MMNTANELFAAFPDKEYQDMAKRRMRQLKEKIDSWSIVGESIMQDEDLINIPPHIPITINDKKELKRLLKDNIKYMSCTGKWFWMQALKSYMNNDPDVIEYETLKNYMFLCNMPKRKQSNKKDISLIKSVPILSIFHPVKPRKFGDKTSCCCPIHNDDTPSFYIYHKTNSFYCFGCGEHGDVIDLYSYIHNTDFKASITELEKMV